MATAQGMYKAAGGMQAAITMLKRLVLRPDGKFITQLGLINLLEEVASSYEDMAETLTAKDAEIARLKKSNEI